MEVKINNKLVQVPKALRDVTLQEFIRDVAGLKGTKLGCGIGLCGACTVHINGVATRSCQVIMSETADQKITTIEGLSETSPSQTLHPVQQAWIENSVPQCGYCQAGQIMTASAFLERNPDPSSEEIRDEMSANLCRCGTYSRIREAIAQVARKNNDDSKN